MSVFGVEGLVEKYDTAMTHDLTHRCRGTMGGSFSGAISVTCVCRERKTNYSNKLPAHPAIYATKIAARLKKIRDRQNFVKNISHNEIIVTDEINQRFTEGSSVSCSISPNE